MRPILAWIFAAVACLALGACADSTQPSTTVASVTVTPAADTLAALDATVQLAATARDAAGAAIPGATFTWSSSDAARAAVSSTGLVTAVANGTATVTATSDGVAGSMTIRVAQVATAVTVTPAALTLVSVAETMQLGAAAQDANGHPVTGAAFAWASSDETVATVSATGLVTAAGNGTAELTATADGVTGNTTVTVAQATATVAVDPPTALLESLNDTVRLTAAARDAKGNDVAGMTFDWSSSDQSVATVGASGLVTAVANGAATISATLAGDTLAASAAITVTQKAATVTVSPGGASVAGVGASRQFAATARDAGGSPIAAPVVTWSSLNPALATVDPSTGEATAVESGQVTIAAAVNDVRGYALLTVSMPGAVPVNLWSVARTGANSELLWGVWGASAADVYVLGDAGMLHYDGATWSTMADHRGYAVWGTSAADLFLVGWMGSVRHYDGTSWQVMETGTGSDLRAVWGASPVDVFAVGTAGTILHYDGTAWTAMASGTFQELRAVWGTSTTNVYAVGREATLLHYDGTSWTNLGSGTTVFTGIWGTSPADVYLVGESWTVAHYDGTGWHGMTGGMIQWPGTVWGTSPTDIYVMGSGGAMMRHDGATWRVMVSGTGSGLHAVTGTSAGDVHVVGTAGLILRGVRGASVTITPAAPAALGIGGTVRLDAAARDAAQQPVGGVTFAWRSGDLAVATVDGTGLVTAAGLGTAAIITSAPGGAADTVTITVVEFPGAPVVSIDNPGQDTTVTLGDAVDFRATATDPDGTIVSHTWDFGDGGGGGVEDPGSHIYAAEGTYTVTYQVTDDDGLTSNPATVVVRVDASPIVPGAWEATVPFGTVEFTVNAASTAVTFAWFRFATYTCGTATVSGSIGFGSTWWISNDQFAMDATAGNDRFEFVGTFTPAGTAASGTWRVTLSGNVCSGTWQGVPAGG